MKKNFTFFTLLLTTLLFSQTNVNPLIPYRDGKLWGFCDTLGKVVVKPYFDKVIDVRYNPFEFNKAAFLLQKNNKKFVVNEKNQISVPVNHTYDSIRLKEFDINYVEVFKNGKMGLYSNLKEIIPCDYDNIDVMGNKSFRVYIGNKCGIINSKNKLIVPIKYNEIYPSWDDEDQANSKYVWDASNDKERVKYYDIKIALNGDEALGALLEKRGGNYESDYSSLKSELFKKYDKVEFDEYRNVAYVTKNNKIGVYSLLENRLFVDTIYDEVSYSDTNKGNAVFKVKLNGKFGLIIENNIVLLPIEYDKIEFNQKISQLEIFKNNKVGIKVLNTIYPTIEPKYIEFLDREGIPINNSWGFNIFLVKTENGIGYVGENGVEYFKN